MKKTAEVGKARFLYHIHRQLEEKCEMEADTTFAPASIFTTQSQTNKVIILPAAEEEEETSDVTINLMAEGAD